MAAAWGHLDMAQLLIDNGADPSVRDDDGMTPFMIASHSKRVPDTNLKRVIEYLRVCFAPSPGGTHDIRQ
jgi:ankyrin repeat protein